jgi:hypothetical protein
VIAPVQLPLPRLADPRYKGPLCAIETAKDLLGRSEDEIGLLVDGGQVVAFDIRSPGAARRDLRILTASISEFNRDSGSEDWVSTITPAQAVALVMRGFKTDKPYVTGKEIKAVLNCGRQHGVNLVSSKVLPQMPGTKYRRGPKGYALIPRPDFVQFLTHRLEGSI